MCGRITQKSDPRVLGLDIASPIEPISFVPRYNGAPGQLHLVIRQHPESGERTLAPLLWGLVPRWMKDEHGGGKPINAKSETITQLPSFREGYKRQRCLVPVDSFFEWKAISGSRAKQPYAIGMRDGRPFALAGIWENWRHPATSAWIRTFCIVTTHANDVLADVHDRMPVIVPPQSFDRWLACIEPDPHDLLVPYPAAPMCRWPVSVRVGKTGNDDATILDMADVEIRTLL